MIAYILFDGIYEDREVKKVFKTRELAENYFNLYMREERETEALDSNRRGMFSCRQLTPQEVIDRIHPDIEEHEILEELGEK